MNDDELLAGVRDAFTVLDPVPRDVLSTGRAALAWRLPAAALAELTLEGAAGAARGTRGGYVRALTFTCPAATIEAEVAEAGRAREISGRIVPGTAVSVLVRHRDLPPGGTSAPVEPGGLFCLPAVPPGLVSLVFRLDAGASVVTSWARV